MIKQTKEATKKVAKQQQMVEEADKKHPTTLNDTEERLCRKFRWTKKG
ncbi:hypothetical protein CsSME_00020382 [Camellia sinensis var. sinensis]